MFIAKLINKITSNFSILLRRWSVSFSELYHIPGLIKVLKLINDINPEIVVVTVAFNHPEFIDVQLKEMNELCIDPYISLIADNSDDRRARKEIRRVTEINGGLYLSLPLNPHNGTSFYSGSHGWALNYVYKNVLQKLRNKQIIFMTMDHDLFPFKSFSIKGMLGKSSCYGCVQERDNGWYYWPGFSIYNVNMVGDSIDFMPCDGLDTGGSIYLNYLRHFDKQLFRRATERKVFIYDDLLKMNNEHEFEITDQSSYIWIINESFVHIIDGSNWSKNEVNSIKVKYVLDLLQAYKGD